MKFIDWLNQRLRINATTKAPQRAPFVGGAGAGDTLSQFNRALYQWMGAGAPLFDDSNDINYIRKGYQAVSDLYSVVSWIATKAAKIRFEVYDMRTGDKVEVPEVSELLYRPNSQMSATEFMQLTYSFYLVSGNAYNWVMPRTSGRGVLEMHVMPSQWTQIVTGGWTEPVKGYTMNFRGDVTFPSEQVLHVKTPNLDYNAGSELYGMSPIRSGWNVIQKAKSNQDASKRAFDNQGAAGLIYRKESVNTFLTSEQFSNLQERAKRVISGSDKSGRIIAEDGDFGYINFGLSPVDLNLLADSEATLLDICNLYHVPGQLFNVTSGQKYDNMEAAGRMAYTDAILPIVNSWADKFTAKVLQPHYGGSLTLTPIISDIPELQKNKREQVEWLQGASWLTVNEKRAEMDYAPVEGGDVILTDGSDVPLEFAGLDKPIPEP